MRELYETKEELAGLRGVVEESEGIEMRFMGKCAGDMIFPRCILKTDNVAHPASRLRQENALLGAAKCPLKNSLRCQAQKSGACESSSSNSLEY